MGMSYPMRVPHEVVQRLEDLEYVADVKGVGAAMAWALEQLFERDPDLKQRCEAARKTKKP